MRRVVTDPRWLPLWVWVGYMLALPIVDWLTAGEAYPLLSTIGVLLQLGAVLIFLSRAWPWPRLAATVVVAVSVTWLLEWVGSTTGLPFGEYDYSALLQPQLFGVPLLIPL
ncbi:MAG: carotenoid biosynthesis protein, partial [Anaerolineales bacterium]|nr:carotenoid biosynthesis protein [Anaerolineales bacterium]